MEKWEEGEEALKTTRPHEFKCPINFYVSVLPCLLLRRVAETQGPQKESCLQIFLIPAHSFGVGGGGMCMVKCIHAIYSVLNLVH